MTGRLQRVTPILRAYALRIAWAALVLLHLPPLVRASAGLTVRYADPAAWLGVAALALTTLFFFLKLCDVAFLRFRATRASATAFLLATVLVHQNATHSVLVSLTEPPAAATLATFTLGLRVYQSRRIRHLLKHLAQTGRRAICNLPLVSTLTGPPPRLQPDLLRLRSGPSRAPPRRGR